MHSHETWYHCLQVVHSQPPGVHLLHNLSLLTVSFLVSILGILVAVSLHCFRSSICILWLYLCETHLYSHLRLTDSHSHPRKTADWPTNALRSWFWGSKYFGGPNTTVKFGPGVQLLRGSKYYVTSQTAIAKCQFSILLPEGKCVIKRQLYSDPFTLR